MTGKAVVRAEPGQRLLARLIDTLIVGLPVALVARAALPADVHGPQPAETATALGVAVLFMLYDTLQVTLWGRTAGKRLAGIVVVPADRPAPTGPIKPTEPIGRIGRIGLPRAALRAAVFALPIAARPVPVLDVVAGVFWVVNALLVLEPSRRQALHDRLVATTVVRDGEAGA